MIVETAMDLCAALDQYSVQENCSDEQRELMACLRAIPADAAQQIAKLRQALGDYAHCVDGCTCGDGWDHNTAREALGLEKYPR